MVDLPECSDNLRTLLNIPENAIVYGRYGGFTSFNIHIAHEAIIEWVQKDENSYYLFMNTKPFYKHSRIIYLDKTTDLNYKVKFINTCDAMIHARIEGETFGLSIAEFSIKNKPVITCESGDLGHILILEDKCVKYKTKNDIINIFKNIQTIIKTKDDWNAYRNYLPSNVMNMFNRICFKTNIQLYPITFSIPEEKIVDKFSIKLNSFLL